jgi:hypothetical protein
MTGRGYVPDRGEVVWLDFNPQAGHEQAGRHPALVLSPVISGPGFHIPSSYRLIPAQSSGMLSGNLPGGCQWLISEFSCSGRVRRKDV